MKTILFTIGLNKLCTLVQIIYAVFRFISLVSLKIFTDTVKNFDRPGNCYLAGMLFPKVFLKSCESQTK